MERDRGICQYCFDKADTVDHVVPVSVKADHRMQNKVAACQDCNRIKGGRVFDSIAEARVYINKIKSERAEIEPVWLPKPSDPSTPERQ
jgi:5-methylcytosine-specific restriction endonuclease McrA